MQEISVKKNKHLLIFEVPANYSAGHLESLTSDMKRMLGEDIAFMVLQPETKITLLKLED